MKKYWFGNYILFNQKLNKFLKDNIPTKRSYSIIEV